MTRRPTPPHRRLLCAARRCLLPAFALLLLIAPAEAQTVTVINARPGAMLDAVWIGRSVGTAVVDPLGNASVAMGQLTGDDSTRDVRVLVDACDATWRVLVVPIGSVAASAEAGCAREEMAGVFVLQPISTLVVNVSGGSATLRLRQGEFDPTAPVQGPAEGLTGVVLFGGGGLTMTGSDAGERACGNVSNCERSGMGLGYTAGALWWFVPYVGIEASFLKPADVSVEGSGAGHQFTSGLDAGVLSVAGLFGGPIGNARLYGKVGATYHRATFTTTQTFAPMTDAEGTPIAPGGTQVLQSQTGGLGLLLGGGVEVWLNRVVGIYVEGGRAGLNGSDLDEAESTLDDRSYYALVGIRVRLGG